MWKQASRPRLTDDRMGTIIQLKTPQRAAPAEAAGEVLPQCEIVIFPGVRIERTGAPLIVDASDPQADDGTGHGRPRKSS